MVVGVTMCGKGGEGAGIGGLMCHLCVWRYDGVLVDTHEMVERWRKELGEGTAPLTGLAEQRNPEVCQAGTRG